MKRPFSKLVFMVCLCVGLLQGCSESETTAPLGEKPRKTFLIGLTPEQNIFKQLDRYEPLAEYLSDKIDMKVKLIVLTRYGNIIDNFVSTGLDGAFFGSFTYALAHAGMGVEPLARPESFDGKSTYHGLIITRKDSGITSVTDMKSKRFAFVDRETTAGYLFPIRYFQEHGVESYKTYLREWYFAGTHEDVIYDILNKKTDIGAAKNTVYERLAGLDKSIKDNLVILERSPEVPENCLAVKKGTDISVKSKLKRALLNMHEDPAGNEILKKFGAKRFIETTDADYDSVYEYAREIHLDLSTYHSRKKRAEQKYK